MRARSRNETEPFPTLVTLGGTSQLGEWLRRGEVFGVGTEAASTASTAAEPSPASVTLAGVYLSQGHREEARRVLHQLLDREPDHPAGRRLAAQIEGRAGRLTAADLLDEPVGGASLDGRKRLLEAYLRRLREAAGRGPGS